jgi:hypothetical protein
MTSISTLRCVSRRRTVSSMRATSFRAATTTEQRVLPVEEEIDPPVSASSGGNRCTQRKCHPAAKAMPTHAAAVTRNMSVIMWFTG